VPRTGNRAPRRPVARPRLTSFLRLFFLTARKRSRILRRLYYILDPSRTIPPSFVFYMSRLVSINVEVRNVAPFGRRRCAVRPRIPSAVPVHDSATPAPQSGIPFPGNASARVARRWESAEELVRMGHVRSPPPFGRARNKRWAAVRLGASDAEFHEPASGRLRRIKPSHAFVGSGPREWAGAAEEWGVALNLQRPAPP